MKELSEANANANLVRFKSKIREGSLNGTRETICRKRFVKEMSFKSAVKGRGSDRW